MSTITRRLSLSLVLLLTTFTAGDRSGHAMPADEAGDLLEALEASPELDMETAIARPDAKSGSRIGDPLATDVPAAKVFALGSGADSLRRIEEGAGFSAEAVPGTLPTLKGSGAGAALAASGLQDHGDGPQSLLRLLEVTCPPESIDLAGGAALEGILDAGDCRLPQFLGEDTDHALADSYRFRVPERSRVSIDHESSDFALGVVLLGGQGLILIDAPLGGGGQLGGVAPILPPGDYFLFVTSGEGDSSASGAYRLNASMSAQAPPAPCTASPLVPGETTGTTDPADCRFFDYVPGLTLQSRTDAYALEMDASGRLSLGVTSGDFFPAVAVASNGRLVDFADGAGPGVALDIALPAGAYQVLVFSLSPDTGAYRLTTEVQPAGDGRCEPEPALIDEEMSGSLAEGDCQMAWIGGGGDQSWVDLYAVVVPQFLDTWSISLQADGFHPAMRFLDLQLNPVLQGVESPEGSRIDLRIESVAASTYILAVESAGPGMSEGDYELEVDLIPVAEPVCTVEALAPNGNASGSLSDTDCYLANSYGQIDTGSQISDLDARLDQYRVEVDRRGRLSANLGSAEVDMALVFYDAAVTYPTIYEDPASMDASGSVIVQPGTYIVLVSSLTPDLGDYQLQLGFEPQAAPDCGPTPLGFGAPMDGALTEGDCYFGDILDGDFLQRRADAYRISLPERGRLTLEMSSDEIDAYLELYPADGEGLLDFGRDIVPGFDLDAAIEIQLPAGDYLLVASSDIGIESGSYRVEADFEALTADCSAADLAVDETREGSLTEESCRTSDLPGGGSRGVATDVYRLIVPQLGRLEIEMNSEDPAGGVDPALFLYSSDWQLLASNDDLVSGILFDAYLPLEIITGAYYLVAATSTGLTGGYELVTSFEPADYEFVPSTPGTPRPTATGGPIEPTATPLPPTTETPAGPGGEIYLPVLRKD